MKEFLRLKKDTAYCTELDFYDQYGAHCSIAEYGGVLEISQIGGGLIALRPEQVAALIPVLQHYADTGELRIVKANEQQAPCIDKQRRMERIEAAALAVLPTIISDMVRVGEKPEYQDVDPAMLAELVGKAVAKSPEAAIDLGRGFADAMEAEERKMKQ